MQTLKLLLFLCFIQFSFGLKASDLLKRPVLELEDTIIVNELNWTDQQLVIFKDGRYSRVPYPQVVRNYPYKIYRAKDTSLFTGFLLYEQREKPHIGYFSVTAWDFKDGMPASMTSYYFVASPDSMNHALFPYYHFNSAFQWKGSVSQIDKDWGEKGVGFFPDGDTSMVFEGTSNTDITETYFFKNGDTLSHYKRGMMDGIDVTKSFIRNEKGELSDYSRTERLDGAATSIIWYQINEHRDTINCRRLENGVEYNLQTMKNDLGKLLTIRTTLKYNELTDIQNENVLCLDKEFDIVSEEKFIQLNKNSDKGYHFNLLYLPIYSKKGQLYELMMYPGNANFPSKKYGKKLYRYARRFGKKK